MAVVILLAGETREKTIRAVVNLSAPLSAVYSSWFSVLGEKHKKPPKKSPVTVVASCHRGRE